MKFYLILLLFPFLSCAQQTDSTTFLSVQQKQENHKEIKQLAELHLMTITAAKTQITKGNIFVYYSGLRRFEAHEKRNCEDSIARLFGFERFPLYSCLATKPIDSILSQYDIYQEVVQEYLVNTQGKRWNKKFDKKCKECESLHDWKSIYAIGDIIDDEVVLNQSGDYVIYNSYGSIILSGNGKTFSIKTLLKGVYTMDFQGGLYRFIKK